MTVRGARWCLALLMAGIVGLLGACGSAGEPLQLPGDAPTVEVSAAPAEAGTPAGAVAVAYSDVPATWHGVGDEDVAATDLAALWGLPLYRYGPDGLLRPGLADTFRIDDGPDAWAVEIDLRPGTWSDGQPVTAADVVATVEVLRASSLEAEFAVVESVAAVDQDTVRFAFAEPYARWPHLLAGGRSVLPAHVLEEEGLAAFADAVPVSGGWFRLDAFESGFSARFVAHRDSPLGAPGIETVEVLFTPRYEASLGLLDEQRVTAVAGHLALNPVGRAERVGRGVKAAAPLGGTSVVLDWDADVPDEIRRALGGVADVSQLVEGLLGPYGEVATSPWPGTDGPWGGAGRTIPDARSIGTLRVLIPRWHEVTGFTARALQRDASVLEGSFEIVSAETPDFVEQAQTEADVVLRIRRDGSRPALAGLVDAVTGQIRSADAAPDHAESVIADGFEEAHDQARIRPLYRVGVAHAWRQELRGVRPSSWPGVIFWNVGEWRLEAS